MLVIMDKAKIANGLPWCLSGKEFTCKCRKLRFNPWVRKVPWRRKWQPSILAWETPGKRSLAGYSPQGHKGVQYDLVTKQ